MGLRILIVEDEAITAMWLEMEVVRSGHTVVGTVGNGSDAIRMAKQEQPAVVLMDIRLTGPMDGIETAKVINETVRCAVIFMSAYADQLLRLRLEPVRSLGYLSKPVEMAKLERLLTEVR